MTKLVFCDVEGTLLSASFPGLMIAEGRRMRIFSPWQLTQIGVLGFLARSLPGKVGRALGFLAMLRSVAGSSVATMERLLEHAMPHVIDQLKPAMVARLQRLQADGYELVLVSAGLEPAVARLAAALGGRGEGSRVARRGDRYLGKLDGPACQGAGKAARVQAILTERQADPQDCIGFGDTLSDSAFLALLGHPTVVDPEPALAAAAAVRGWPIIQTDAVTVSDQMETQDHLSADAIEAQAQDAMHRFATPQRRALRDRDRERLALGAPMLLRNGLAATIFTPSAPSSESDSEHAPTVLLVHGWEGRGINLANFIDPLLAHGMRVIALDGPAHGASPGNETDPVDFAEALLSTGEELGPLAGIIAHSMGGGSTAIALSRGLRVDRVVLIASPAALETMPRRFAEAVALPDKVAARFLELIAARHDVPPEAYAIGQLSAGLKTPALIIHDRDDAEVPFSEGEMIAANWPHARFLITEGRGHRRILLAPEVVQEAVAFLTEAPVHVG